MIFDLARKKHILDVLLRIEDMNCRPVESACFRSNGCPTLGINVRLSVSIGNNRIIGLAVVVVSNIPFRRPQFPVKEQKYSFLRPKVKYADAIASLPTMNESQENERRHANKHSLEI